MGTIGPITFSTIDRYATRIGITDPQAFERFALLLRAMDGAYLKHVRATVAPPKGAPALPPPSPS
jgi:hypothetical protein